MSFRVTFCGVPISTRFDGHATSSCVSLDWVINSGLHTRNSQASGVLTLPANMGAISMFLNNVPVAASLPSDLLLGLDWFNLAVSLAPERVVYLDFGVSLNLRRSGGITEPGPSNGSPCLFLIVFHPDNLIPSRACCCVGVPREHPCRLSLVLFIDDLARRWRGICPLVDASFTESRRGYSRGPDTPYPRCPNSIHTR
ncbi:hypothetical protein C8F04DRAFT_1130642 [Mycena alexandri]|uniref:Uncharacterized protein n=1 Tax=Mycena alexandri TaxID=1745969 RepID=A0AAD6SCX2_9AGAR|nr:hypothetical protein C8F04DRAFT_1130642 [Mycena alexandri]